MTPSNLCTSGALALTTFLASVAPATAQLPITPSRAPYWEELGPMPGAGPEVIQLASSAADADRIYASSRAGVLESFNRGVTWELRSRHSAAYNGYAELSASPTDADTLVQTSFGGPFRRSVDGGQTWLAPTVPPGGPTLWSPQFASSDTVYVSASFGVWRSLDGGDHFEEVLADLMGGFCRHVGVDANDPLHVYAPVGDVGLFVTVDGGASWTTKPMPVAGYPLSFAVDPIDGDRVLLGTAGIYLTTDGGDTWSDISPWWSTYVDSVAFDPVDPLRFYAGFRGEGFAVTDDGGATWTVITDPGLDTSGGNAWSILPSTVHAGQVVVGQSGGLFRSTDSGVTFERVNYGLDAYATVRALAVDPFDPMHLVAITGGSAFVSHDEGASWIEASGIVGLATFDVVADRLIPGRFYVGNWNDGFWRSDDGGHTFYESHSGGPHFAKLAAHPTVGGRVFGAGLGLQRSDDGGLTFIKTSAPLGWSWATAISPADPDVMYVSGTSKVLHSLDGGVTWQDATTKPVGIVRELFADPLDPNRAYAAVPLDGLYRTDDHGANWTLLAPDFEDSGTVTVPDFDRSLTIANDLRRYGAHISRDGGVYAGALGRGLVTPVLDFANAPTKLFAGTTGQGVVVLRY